MVNAAQYPGDEEVKLVEIEEEPLVAPGAGYIGYAFPDASFESDPVVGEFPVIGDDEIPDSPLVRDVILPVIQNAWQHYQAGMAMIKEIRASEESA